MSHRFLHGLRKWTTATVNALWGLATRSQTPLIVFFSISWDCQLEYNCGIYFTQATETVLVCKKRNCTWRVLVAEKEAWTVCCVWQVTWIRAMIMTLKTRRRRACLRRCRLTRTPYRTLPTVTATGSTRPSEVGDCLISTRPSSERSLFFVGDLLVLVDDY